MGFEIEREIGKSEMKLEKLGLLMIIDDVGLSNFWIWGLYEAC